jgi:hypothetical protein
MSLLASFGRSAERARRLRIAHESDTGPQRAWIAMKGPRLLWRAANQVGKAQPKDAQILTPTGWRRMGDLVVGDLVIAGDGSPTRVTSVFEQGMRPVFRVTFDDGASTECCGEHLWPVLQAEGLCGELDTTTLQERLQTGGDAVTMPAYSKAGAAAFHTLTGIEPARVTDTRCIEVDHPSETYVTDDYIVTHNSRGLAKKLIHFIRRTGPYADRRPGPVKVLVMSFSREQMVPLHEKLWELLPKDEIDDKVAFEPGYGFRGKPPRITFTSGEGKGSVLIFASYKQGARRAAGGTFDVVALDEPVEERIWGEIQPRVLHGTPGEVWVTFTPTPDSPPLDYLRKMVEDGRVREMVTDLTLANVTLSDGRALLDQAGIDTYAGSLLEVEKDMRLRGGWDIIATERALDNWGPHCIGRSRAPAGAIVAVGIDHGAGSGKQAAALLAITDAQGLEPRVWLLAEHLAEGFTTPDIDAQAILDMLQRAGLNYDNVDVWVGDRASGMNKYDVRKSNGDLQRQLARLIGRPMESTKRIEVPYKWDGSVMYGFRLVNAMMGRRDDGAVEGDKMGGAHFQVVANCPKFANAASKWKWNPRAPEKDILDAVRYPIEKIVKPGQWFSFKVQYS